MSVLVAVEGVVGEGADAETATGTAANGNTSGWAGREVRVAYLWGHFIHHPLHLLHLILGNLPPGTESRTGEGRIRLHGAGLSGVVWCGVVWCGVVWGGVGWSGVVWDGVVWCGMVWCGVVWIVGCVVAAREELHVWFDMRWVRGK